MIETQEKEIVATLYVQGQEFDMLEINPNKRASVPFWMQEYTFEFLVIVEGFAQPVIASRNGFLIVPLLEPMTRTVKFLIDKEDESKKLDDLHEELLESD